MTVSYSLNVSQATFKGFAKLLLRWKGSLYKSMWRECVIFCVLFLVLQLILRHAPLAQEQKTLAWNVITFLDSIIGDIPFFFVLGFFVNFVASRWSSQSITIPWPDRVYHLIASYVHGSDERSRMIRRTLGRYTFLLQCLTFQTVSTAVKRRFPTTHHLVEAGIMTKEEWLVYEKVDFSYGKWWLPCDWFTALATRAKKEGRIKDSLLLNTLLQELLNYRNMCASTIAYDWISVPLAYTQVATITTYLYALTLLIGKQTLDVPESYAGFVGDFYFPFVTIWKFIFTMGWLKVAQQLLNPYGEDDDDFELNWCLDRAVNLAYKVVDEHHLMHPKVRKDAFWDLSDIKLPQTEHSAKYMKNPEMGTALKLQIQEVKYLPMEELIETDDEENNYKSPSVKKKDADRQNSSFIRRVLGSRFSQSARRKSRKTTAGRSLSCKQGISNPSFSMTDEVEDAVSVHSTAADRRRSSLKNLIRKVSPANRSSAKLRQNSLILKRVGSRTSEETEMTEAVKGMTSQKSTEARDEAIRTLEWSTEKAEGMVERDESEGIYEYYPERQGIDDLMAPIPEEMSRVNSLASIELKAAAQRGERPSLQLDKAYDIIKGASEALREITQTTAAQERWTMNEGKGYESCCSEISSEGTSEGSSEKDSVGVDETDNGKVAVTIELTAEEDEYSRKAAAQ